MSKNFGTYLLHYFLYYLYTLMKTKTRRKKSGTVYGTREGSN
jgi:hypothetical protein